MATSPNYAWAEPDNSSLVKNGASDIRTLGDAIDTSVWNVGFGQAGKNKVINGDFSINQRNFTTDTIGAYGFDRWTWGSSGATGTYSTQAFTAGAAPVAGYEATNFARVAVTTGNDFCRLIQRIESVRTFAGQTATLSFWAKGTNPTTAGKLNLWLSQNFGSGGSASVNSAEQDLTLTANWTRYSYTFALPSISGKTIGTASYLEVGIGQLSNASAQSWTLDLWGIQLEYGSKATPFQTASGGNPQAELAMCQRYYVRLGAANGLLTTAYATYGNGYTTSTTNASIAVPLPVPMRIIPTGIDFSTLAILSNLSTLIATSAVVINGSSNSNTRAHVEATVVGAVAASYQTLQNNNNTSGYIGFSAEL